jgi:uncharacterized membrane protein YbhN (UPF0104 family)
MGVASPNPSALAAPQRLPLLVLLAAGLAAAASIGLAWTVGFQRVLAGLTHPRWEWLAVAVAAEVVAYLGYTAAYREVARAEGGTELGVPRAAALVAVGFGVFVHGGGFALDRAALRRAGLSAEEARSRVLGLGTLEYAVLAPATCVAAAVIVVRAEPVSGSMTLPWLIGVPVGAALAFGALALERRFARWPRVTAALGSLRLVLRIFCSPRRYGLAVAGVVAYWSGELFCLWAALHAFSAHPPPVAQLVVGYSTGYALTRRALPLGGAGVVEALLPAALAWLGIAFATALLAVFAYRLINLWLPMAPALAGLPTLRRLERSSRRRPEAARPGSA